MTEPLVLYVYRCVACKHAGEERLRGDSHDGAASACIECGEPVVLEWDGGVVMETTSVLAAELSTVLATAADPATMTQSNEERDATAAMQHAAQALTRAVELSERAGYGSQVMASLEAAQKALRYALDTAMGRN